MYIERKSQRDMGKTKKTKNETKNVVAETSEQRKKVKMKFLVDRELVDAIESVEDPSRTIVNLSNKSLSGLRLKNEDKSRSFRRLRKLSLAKNAITSLKSIGACTHLTFLKCDENKIEDFSEVTRCKMLATLNLSKNRIQNIPMSISSLNVLEALVLTGNQLKDVATLKHANLKVLNTLVLSRNELTSESFTKESGLLESMPSLTTLSISHNKLTEFPFVAYNKNIQNLRLNANEIKTVPSLKRLKQLKLLDLGKNRISEWTDLERIATSCSSGTLTNLNVAGNPIEENDKDYATRLCQLFANIPRLDGKANGDSHKKRLKRRHAYGTEIRGTNVRKRSRRSNEYENREELKEAHHVQEEVTTVKNEDVATNESEKKKKKKRKKKKEKKSKTGEMVMAIPKKEERKMKIRGASSGVVGIISKESTEKVESKKRKLPPSILTGKSSLGEGAFGMGGTSAW